MRPGEMRFVAKGCIKGGDKVLADLVAWGLAFIGARPSHSDKGYRITLTGSAALKTPQPAAKPRRPKISMQKPLVPSLPPRIKPMK